MTQIAEKVLLDRTKLFETEHLKADLKGRSIRGGAVTLGAQAAKFILQTGSTMILARLLTPVDFGLIAMVAAFTDFVGLFKDLGLSMSTVQREHITHGQISTLFWTNVILSILLMLISAAMAPAVAWFYGEPRLTLITIAIACTFIFGGLSSQHTALLRRQMRFGDLALVEIVSMTSGIAAGIAAAWYGLSFWSLVIMTATTGLVTTAMVWLYSGWGPGRPVRGSGIRPMLAFGGHLTSFSVVNYFARNLDNVLLGRFCGAGVLGLYSKAYNLMMLPIAQVRGPLQAVAVPALSHLQNDPTRFKSYYLKLISLISFLTMPLMVFLFFCADQVILLLLGDQWLGVVGIFRILCIAALIQPVAGTAGLVLVSLGQSKRYLAVGTINGIVVAISFVLGLPWGAMGVAAALTIVSYVTLVPVLWYSLRRSPIPMADFFRAMARPAAASLCMGAAVFAGGSFLANLPDMMRAGACLVIGLVAYLLALGSMPGGTRLLREFLSLGLLALRKDGSTSR